MLDFASLKHAMESWKYEEEEESTTPDVSIDQTIEVSIQEDVVQQEEEEVVEEVQEAEETSEEVEQLLAHVEYQYHLMTVLREHGYNRVIAEIVNYDQVPGVRRGSFESFLGITLPANESLDMYASAYDDNTQVCLEGLKESISNLWEWIRKKMSALFNFLKDLGSKLVNIFAGYDKISAALAAKIKEKEVDPEKAKEKKFNISTQAIMDGLFRELGRGSMLQDIQKAQDEISRIMSDSGDSEDMQSKGLKVAELFKQKLETTLDNFGLKIDVKEEGSVFSGISIAKKDVKKEILGIEERTFAEAGFTKQFLTDNQRVVVLANTIATKKLLAGSTALLKNIEKRITRMSKLVTDEAAAEDYRKQVSVIKSIMGFVSGLKSVAVHVDSLKVQYCKAFVTAQKAFLACSK